MLIKKLSDADQKGLEKYLQPHRRSSLFIYSNMLQAGLSYHGQEFGGEYFAAFQENGVISGVIAHYWNGNMMMQAENPHTLNLLLGELEKNRTRPIAGVLGLEEQAWQVIESLGLTHALFSANKQETLYALSLSQMTTAPLGAHMSVTLAKHIDMALLLSWITDYSIEALGGTPGPQLEQQVAKNWKERLKKDNVWVLLVSGTPCALSGFNAEIPGMVQVGPVWTPPEYRNQGFAKILLSATLSEAFQRGVSEAILFTNNPAADRAYRFLGFEKIGLFRLALLQHPT